MGNEHKEIQEAAAEHDAEKGEEGDSGKATAAAAHQARNDAQDEAEKGDELSQRITENWTRDRSSKEDVPSKEE